MKNKNTITIIVALIVVFSGFAAASGILSRSGSGQYNYTSIRGQDITIYGRGIYAHMSADVAIQGIAQDYVTAFLGIPLLLLGLFLFRKKSVKGQFLLAGTLAYFLVTYLFYTAMAMYNKFFLVYVSLLVLSFFGLLLTLFSFKISELKNYFVSGKPVKYSGIFLMINSIMVALLWLGVVVPPLLDGTIYPKGLQHYTTLIVQGFDLGLLLPIAFVSGLLAVKKNRWGYLFAPVKVIFLAIMMAALTSKIIFMAKAGANVIPVIFIMPTICLISILFSIYLLKSISSHPGKVAVE
ncbi:MAG: hypothetical protein PF689_08440 [Deltaproteobacteria bacterium]|jgi:hypothetical protein|nr:hypothetical protein [Deltaproteobacteria bacterium]